jgi:hypothetical protein
MIVRLKRRRKDAQRLTVGVDYFVVQVDDVYYRVVNDSGEPILYKKDRFVVIDERIPDDWIRTDHPDGEYFIGPPETETRGFWELWHDRDPEARTIAMDALRKIASWHLDRGRGVRQTTTGRLGKTE